MSKETSDREKFVKTGSNDFGVSFLAERWNTKAENFIQKQKTNPFSGRYDGNERVRWIKGAKEYAQPVGLTAERGAKAKRYISKDIEVLCHIIEIMGKPDDNGNICTTFGELFERRSICRYVPDTPIYQIKWLALFSVRESTTWWIFLERCSGRDGTTMLLSLCCNEPSCCISQVYFPRTFSL
ncbi:actin-binding Rho-activating protein-like isoform X1 [Clavelina lepadiformis]|uniref:actin-binding Rho-activating protein-like isoform X1 n=1 Tax=Clavelina lepadiformis TaxID=159417 RepID=UPI0040420E4E